MSEPRRAGLMQLLRESSGCQFVIPVYQRNYTWKAEREVKQYFDDLTCVLDGKYKNHFLGILIYLEKSIDFSKREFSIIDGQQRMTTTFLILYAIKRLFEDAGEVNMANQLDAQYLTNAFDYDAFKYKLKPLVTDDNVYRCIVDGRMDDIADKESCVLKNYLYIQSKIKSLIELGYTANDILLAMDKLYVVCVPVNEEDNAQKIFESINATGVKLTAADLIRNYLLMNLQSDDQDRFYANYWKKIEDNVSADSKDLEMFFRVYLAIKTYTLVAKTGVYREFVDWNNSNPISVENLFKDLLQYAKLYNCIYIKGTEGLGKELKDAIDDYRKINSDLPLPAIMEFYHLHQKRKIDDNVLGQLIKSINSYFVRRSICDMDAQNISKLFPTVLRKVLEKCDESYTNIVAVLNQEMVGNNIGTSGSYMPTDVQMQEVLHNANVYKRPALRVALDRIELSNNSAPVDLSKLSIEHLMPQTPTEEWLDELETDEETYMNNLHRLGNLTLASKHDNSKMSNLLWDYKNEVLKDTAHLKLNMPLLEIEKWTLQNIEDRTVELIQKICEVYPYPKVSVMATDEEDIISDQAAREMVVQKLLPNAEKVTKGYSYIIGEGEKGYQLLASKMYPEKNKEKYWFSYLESTFDGVKECKEQYLVLICRYKEVFAIVLPKEFIEKYKVNMNTSEDANGNITKYHIVVHKDHESNVTLLLSKPTLKRVNIGKYVVSKMI